MHAMIGMDIQNTDQLTALTDKDLLKCRNLGKKSLKEIKESLHIHNLSLRVREIPKTRKLKRIKNVDNAITKTNTN